MIIVVIIFTDILVAQKPSENNSLQIIPDTNEESFIKNKRAIGRNKDFADIDAILQ